MIATVCGGACLASALESRLQPVEQNSCRQEKAVALHLEPRPTGQIVLRAEPDLIAEIDRIAAKHQASRSRVTRALIRQGITALEQQG